MFRAGAITLKQLRSLGAIIKGGNLTAAAELLCVTPPAVSTQLRNLEANVGGRVLRRGPGGEVSLTPEGEQVLATADRIEKALGACEEKLVALRAGKSGHVSVGVVSTGKYFAPGLVVRARDAMPDLEFSLKIGNREQIVAALANQTIDLAVMGRPPTEPPVTAASLGAHPYVMIVLPDHPFVGRDDVSADEMLDQIFLCREQGSGTRMLTEHFLERIGEGRPFRTIEIGTNETIKQGVIAGLGVAIISAHTVSAELDTGRLTTVRMKGLPILRQWYVLRRSDEEPTIAALKFQQFLMDQKGDFLPAVPSTFFRERWNDKKGETPV